MTSETSSQPSTYSLPHFDSLSELKMYLVINKRSNKVLYAQANKEVVDFIFDILSLSVLDSIKIVSDSEAGLYGNILKSITNLDVKCKLPVSIYKSYHMFILLEGGNGSASTNPSIYSGYVKKDLGYYYLINDDLTIKRYDRLFLYDLNFDLNPEGKEERVVIMTKVKATNFIKACMRGSTTVFTDVFLDNEAVDSED
ncbi:uncharacterized protein LOC131649079 [Vicia villosa]|uniref:uncharacterized protein LOC131649079 n=1 Tax=Vicia villosa TaxID=3911 RepID=UPI00273ACFC5|nr:uncharacterized protein LOC131649079 [Vicia villosa]